MKLSKLWLLASWLLSANLLWGQIGEVREWTSANGYDGVLISANGKRFTLQLDVLSERDREFLASLAEEVEGDEVRNQGFEEGKYADAVKGKWVKFPKEDLGLLFQLFIGKEVTRKKAGPERCRSSSTFMGPALALTMCRWARWRSRRS